MTEVIGWDDGRPVRPLRRWPWVVLALVVVVAVAAPTVDRRSKAAESRWLAGRWVMRQAYDVARLNALNQVTGLMVPGDEPTLAQAVGLVDREEAAHLRTLAAQVHGRLLFDPTSRRTAAAMRRALLGQAAFLLRPPPASVLPTDIPPAYDARASAAIDRAEALVDRIAAPVAMPTLVLQAPTKLKDRLRRTLDRPIDEKLVVVEPSSAAVIDLASGSRRGLAPFEPADGASTLVTAHSLFVGDDRGLLIVPLDGGPLRHVRLEPVQMLTAAADGDAWVVDTHDEVRLVDGAGHVLRGPVRLPLGTFADTGSGRELVLHAFDSYGTPDLWDPVTNRRRGLPGDCQVGVIASEHALAWLPCGQQSTLWLHDDRTGRSQAVRLPGPIDGFPLISHDGQHVALVYQRPGGHSTIGVYDVAAARWQSVRAPIALTAVAWSPDSRYLLLHTQSDPNGGLPGYPSAQDLSWLWWPGVPDALALRLPGLGTAVGFVG